MTQTAAKVCTMCGQDVSNVKRVKDQQNRYYCHPCWAARATKTKPQNPHVPVSAQRAEHDGIVALPQPPQASLPAASTQPDALRAHTPPAQSSSTRGSLWARKRTPLVGGGIAAVVLIVATITFIAHRFNEAVAKDAAVHERAAKMWSDMAFQSQRRADQLRSAADTEKPLNSHPSAETASPLQQPSKPVGDVAVLAQRGKIADTWLAWAAAEENLASLDSLADSQEKLMQGLTQAGDPDRLKEVMAENLETNHKASECAQRRNALAEELKRYDPQEARTVAVELLNNPSTPQKYLPHIKRRLE